MSKKLFTAFVLTSVLFGGLVFAPRPGLCAAGAVGVMAPSEDINREAEPEQADGQPGGQTGGPRVIRLSPEGDYKGALDIRVHPDSGKLMPSVDFLLIDPTGKKAGTVSGNIFTEFETGFAGYEGLDDDETGLPGPSSGVVDIGNPADGEYVLRVTGIRDGAYSIELNGYNIKSEASHAEILDAPISKGQVKEYRFRYSGSEAPAMELTAK